MEVIGIILIVGAIAILFAKEWFVAIALGVVGALCIYLAFMKAGIKDVELKNAELQKQIDEIKEKLKQEGE